MITFTYNFESCQWNNRNCTASYITETYTDMGKCFTFNYNSSLQSYIAGYTYVVLFLID